MFTPYLLAFAAAIGIPAGATMRSQTQAIDKVAVWGAVDEASGDAEFLHFRGELASAVAQRDVVGVMRRTHPRVTGLRNSLELRSSAERPYQPEHVVWTEMDRLLKLGGSFITDEQRRYGRGTSFSGFALRCRTSRPAASSAAKSKWTRRSLAARRATCRPLAESGRASGNTRVMRFRRPRGRRRR